MARRGEDIPHHARRAGLGRRIEDEMVRGVCIERVPSERMTLSEALDRCPPEVTPTKKASTQRVEKGGAEQLQHALGQYALAAPSADSVARYRDDRLVASTARIELALLGHLYAIAIKEWRLGLATNPVASIRRPSLAAGRDRRLARNEDTLVIQASDSHSNPMFGGIIRFGIETGMRSSEIVGLQRDDVRLSDTKNRSARRVPLIKSATQVLEATLANPARPKDVELVLYGEPGRDGQRRPYVFQKH